MNIPLGFMAGGFGWGEIIVVVLVVLLLFGAKRVPDLARSLGRSLSEFKKGREEGAQDDPPATATDDPAKTAAAADQSPSPSSGASTGSASGGSNPPA